MRLVTHSAEETQALGEALGALAQGGDLFLLVGELGSGKTCLVQGIARGLGVQESVRSPTFVLVTQYAGRHTLFHIDLYRLDDLREIEELGLDEYIEGGEVCVVEWADKGIGFFPREHLVVRLEHRGPQERQVTFIPSGERYESLVELLRQRADGLPPP